MTTPRDAWRLLLFVRGVLIRQGFVVGAVTRNIYAIFTTRRKFTTSTDERLETSENFCFQKERFKTRFGKPLSLIFLIHLILISLIHSPYKIYVSKIDLSIRKTKTRISRTMLKYTREKREHQ